jgi:hypothetical protein
VSGQENDQYRCLLEGKGWLSASPDIVVLPSEMRRLGLAEQLAYRANEAAAVQGFTFEAGEHPALVQEWVYWRTPVNVYSVYQNDPDAYDLLKIFTCSRTGLLINSIWVWRYASFSSFGARKMPYGDV